MLIFLVEINCCPIILVWVSNLLYDGDYILQFSQGVTNGFYSEGTQDADQTRRMRIGFINYTANEE